MSILLAIDSSGKSAGVCVLAGDDVLALSTVDTGLTHSETLLPQVLDTLGKAGMTLDDVGLIAVAGGPGSFTGLRIGMALAKGLALPGNIPAVAASTLEAHAVAAAEAGLQGTVIPALDARRGEVYWAAFDTTDGVRRLAPDAAGPAGGLAQTVQRAKPPVFFVGDGAEICYTIYNLGAQRPPAGYVSHTALGVARIARRQSGQAQSAAALRPSYLRVSQAERERAAREEVT